MLIGNNILVNMETKLDKLKRVLEVSSRDTISAATTTIAANSYIKFIHIGSNTMTSVGNVG